MARTRSRTKQAQPVETAPLIEPDPPPGHMLAVDTPVHVVNNLNVVKDVIDSGVSVAYFLGAKTNGKGAAEGATTYRYVKNIVGQAITEAPDEPIGLEPVKTGAIFELPPIPAAIITDLDNLFRLAARTLGTECIVLFTFDPKYLDTDDPSAGWGVLVPKQANGPASCDYDPTSIVAEKDDDVFIVGSAHSHPGMGAFASHTDIGDQSDFDGIHITFGWHGKSLHTDFHIELQMGGGRFTLSPDIAFAKDLVIEEDHRYDEWMSKVTKKVDPPPKTATPAAGGYGGYGGYGYSSSGNGSNGSGSTKTRYERAPHLPGKIPNPWNVTVLVDVLEDDTLCPSCTYKLDEFDRKRRQCYGCKIYYLLPGETLDDVIAARREMNFVVDELDLEDETWHWKRIQDGKVYTEDIVKLSGKA